MIPLPPLFGETPDALRQQHPGIFPSEHSLRWFLRLHRRKLIEAGAVVLVAGIWRVADIKAFERVVLEAGRQAALHTVDLSDAREA